MATPLPKNSSRLFPFLIYLFLIIAVANKTFQSPLIWVPEVGVFKLNTNKREEVISKLVLIFDILSFLLSFSMIIIGNKYDCRQPFLLSIYFVSPIAFMNIVFDINIHRKKEENLQLLNGFLKLTELSSNQRLPI